jgi:lipopolysaccharide export system protein LptA
MASSRADRRSVLPGALLAVALAAAPGGAARAQLPQLEAGAPIQVDARSSDFDYKNSTLLFKGVTISQGPLSVQAEEAVATGLDFASSRWTFRGKVRITTADGRLDSNDARVEFADNRIRNALITGGPATFQQKRPDGIARGRANRIEYDFDKGTVRLNGGAWLSDGRNEITGRTLVYDAKDRRILATAAEQGDQRVRITINPQKKPPAGAPKP